MNTTTIVGRKYMSVRFFLCLAAAVGSFVACQAATSAAPSFASVDIQSVFNGSKDRAVLETSMKAYADQLSNVFTRQQKSFMLSAAEQKQLGVLLSKDGLTDTDKKTVDTLEAKSKADYDALAALQQKKAGDLTADDSLKLQSLTSEAQNGNQALTDINTAYTHLIDDKKNRGYADEMAKIRDATAKVAQKQGIQIVFDSQVAIYAQLDITKDVTELINK